jgi:putative DNA primase/helicase
VFNGVDSMRTAYDKILEALQDQGSTIWGAGRETFEARCPAHDDRKPSLRVTKGDDRALIYCHAGCSSNAVMEALGLGTGDLYNERTDYLYTTLSDTKVRIVSRRPGKKFTQQVIEKGAATLYRLPEVIAAVATGTPIFVVEGEKDVHSIEAVGGVATTAPGGAGNWNKADVTPLTTAELIVVVDRDGAGRRWARSVQESLSGQARSLRFVEARVGKDASDHVAAGHGLDDFIGIHLEEEQDAGSANLSATVVTFSDVEPEDLDYLWLARLPLGKLVLFDGDPSTGKSTLLLDLAARVSTGRDWPDGTPGGPPTGVLLLSAEDGLADTITPRLIAAGADRERVHALTEVHRTSGEGRLSTGPPSLPDDLEWIEHTIRERGVKLVIIDPLMAYLDGRTDAHRDQDVRRVLHLVSGMAERTGCAVVFIRHLNKTGGSIPMYRGGGSIGIIGAARAAFLVARDPDDPDRRILATLKTNLVREPPSLAYRLVAHESLDCARIVWDPDPVQLTATDLVRPCDDGGPHERNYAATWLVEYLDDNGGRARKAQIMAAAKTDGIACRTLERAMKTAGVISTRSGMGQGSIWSMPSTSMPFAPAPSAGANGGNGPLIDGAV